MPDRSGLRNSILMATDARGRFHEGTLGAITPLPGTCMYESSSSTWLAGSASATGVRTGIVVLLEDSMQGQSNTQAYVSGAHCFLYWPQPGEEMQLLVKDVGGTHNFAVGDSFAIDASTGKLVENNSYAFAPFTLVEAHAYLAVDTLMLFRVNTV